MPWTKQQQKVIDQRDADILVSAAAGSGKTAVLVERIIQKITDEKHPIDVDHLLVVTFTKAAAGEMKERIMAALDEKVREFPGNQHFVKQLSLIHKAQITTIHSFCMNLIRDYFYVLGIDPNTAPGDEGRLSAIRKEILDDLLEEAYEKKEEDFINLIESYSPGKNDNIISEYILKLYENARSHREPEKWLDQAENNISVETKEQFDQAPFMKIILRDARFSIEGAYDTIQEALELALSPGGPYFYEKTLRKDLEIIIKIKEAQTFSELCESFVKMEKPRLSGRKKKTDEIPAGAPAPGTGASAPRLGGGRGAARSPGWTVLQSRTGRGGPSARLAERRGRTRARSVPGSGTAPAHPHAPRGGPHASARGRRSPGG